VLHCPGKRGLTVAQDDRRPRGRPPKPSGERRDHQVTTYFNDTERAMVTIAAELYDMSVSEFVRCCAMATAHHIRPELDEVEEAVLLLAEARIPAEA
tara:strand:+ start:2399 stop:2689 length:291 start_codon:yes stop_codon:yes gene_type:complete